jgi:hypothetical protein
VTVQSLKRSSGTNGDVYTIQSKFQRGGIQQIRDYRFKAIDTGGTPAPDDDFAGNIPREIFDQQLAEISCAADDQYFHIECLVTCLPLSCSRGALPQDNVNEAEAENRSITFLFHLMDFRSAL